MFGGKQAFTLVELIVVITIVGILSTIGFVSYSGYLTGARDSNRTSQMVKLSDSLQVYSATKSLPLPDNYVEIQASGSLIAYQGEVGVDVLETIDYTNGGTDPKDGSYYTYYLTKDRKSMQLMAMMEEQSLSVQTDTSLNSLLQGEMKLNAANYEDRYAKVYGKKLGVLVSAETGTINTPAQEISANVTAGYLDIINMTQNYSAIVDNSNIITGTGTQLISRTVSVMVPKTYKNCKEMYDKQSITQGVNGLYVVSIQGEDYKVDCDMKTNGGGWTSVLFDKKVAFSWDQYQDFNISQNKYIVDAVDTEPTTAGSGYEEYSIFNTGPWDEIRTTISPVSQCDNGDSWYVSKISDEIIRLAQSSYSACEDMGSRKFIVYIR